MLELKNLVKTYKTKGGVEVKALDGVSIKFPDKGMIFLLGKSGSGKSTLLNVAGGLDRPDSGEIIVKGRSSKDFSPSDFDGYRNTFVGFIFQEFNILNEFTIEENISLALQLQDRPNDKHAVDSLLEEVDLQGVGKRKPNTLSGGQKQRVAIARALIKNPEIIMADEPTGSLDSNTGKQVFDTLKKLSEEKLVIIVSHDREFAKLYADRIIELKDGKVVSDETKFYEDVIGEQKNVNVSGNLALIKKAEDLTETDVKKIFNAIKEKGGEVVIATGKEVPEIKQTYKIKDDGKREYFSETTKIDSKEYDGKETKFIKSKLPVSHAIKMGASGLKVKPARLIFTIFLSVVAFTIFGVLSTMMLYTPVYSIAMSLENSAYTDIMLKKSYDVKETDYLLDENGEKTDTIYFEETKPCYTLFSGEEIKTLNENSLGLDFAGVFTLANRTYIEDDIADYESDSSIKFTLSGRKLKVLNKNANYYRQTGLCGFSDCGDDYLKRNGFTLHGAYPKDKTEIALPEYIFNMYKDNYEDINEYNDLIGKNISIDEKMQDLKIVGIYETEIDGKYDRLKNVSTSYKNLTDELKDLCDEFFEVVSNGFNTVAFVSEDFRDAYANVYSSIPVDYRYGMRVGLDSRIQESKVDEKEVSHILTDVIAKRYSGNFFYFDNSGKKADFNLSKRKVYLSAYEILSNNIVINNFIENNAVTENGDGKTYKPEYVSFGKALEKFRNRASNCTEDDISIILNTIINKYNAIVGYKLAENKVLYLKNYTDKLGKYDVVGYYFIKSEKMFTYPLILESDADTFVISKSAKDRFFVKSDGYNVSNYVKTYSSDYTLSDDAVYDMLITKTQNTKKQTYFMLRGGGEFSDYHMSNSLYNKAYESADVVAQLKLIFLLAGLGAGLLSGLMFLNFISVSISAKRKEIGILRAVGARGVDVFKIFFAEAMIIMLICFVLASVLSGILCEVVNGIVLKSIIKIKLFDYGVLNVLMIFGVAFIISFIATFIPVKKSAKKPPVDSIREL